MDDDQKDKTFRDFTEAVNMAPAEIEDWLDSEDSKRVGQKDDGGESVGHQSGRRIVEIRRTRKADLGDDDYHHIKRVIGYVARHSAQGPEEDREHSDWRYSLMNWGHDPCR